MTAAEIVARLEAGRAADFEVERRLYPSIFSYGKVGEWLGEKNGLYYRMLREYVRVFKPRRVCEIGTRHGASAFAMALGGSPVDTFDIDLRAVADRPLLEKLGVTFVRLSRPGECRLIDFHLYDTLFIDIGDHRGDHERAIHDRLVAEGWTGVAFYDDISWEGMRQFWESADGDKVTTDWHGESGFGVVTYGDSRD